MSIKTTVELLCKKYDTRSPFEIAKQKNIIVIFESLGDMRGYYNCCYRQQIIHINNELNERDRLFTCAHELGHAILHPRENTPFLRGCTLFPVNKFEIEANRFAVQLIFSDDDLNEYKEFTIQQIALCLGLNEELVEYKIKLIQKDFMA